MKILFLTSCTGDKAHKPENQLTLNDFELGFAHLQKREKELSEYSCKAVEMYTGQQHLRLVAGVNRLREIYHEDQIDVSIVSAGYGLLSEKETISPYEVTFSTMNSNEISRWSAKLELPKKVLKRVGEYDLVFVLLGKEYLKAIKFPPQLPGDVTWIFLSAKSEIPKLPTFKKGFALPLGNPEAKLYGSAVTALKGRVIELISLQAEASQNLFTVLNQDPEQLTSFLKVEEQNLQRGAKQNVSTDWVIHIPTDWENTPHRKSIKYFIPEWDDLVDLDYDFINDQHSRGKGGWENEVYAHQMFPSPNYDGILVSRAVAEKSKGKAQRIQQMGVHRMLRVPEDFPIMGDCGAFDYIMEKEPPYSTKDVLDYYSNLGFDYGVSVDHLIVKATMDQRDYRYQLTIDNAAEFLREHGKAGLEWTPIGAVQGWDPPSYAEAARQYVAMGYKYIALGGLVRSQTKEIIEIVREVRKFAPPNVSVHLFGIARAEAVRQFIKVGVNSMDSASHLRRAWLGAGQNYFAIDGKTYSAIRIPQADKSFRAKRMVTEGRATLADVQSLERQCLDRLRAYDRGQETLETTLDLLCEYDELVAENRISIRPHLEKTLTDQPWKHCPCEICRRDGVEVIIFRGNNRNRRRGFHNTYVFYRKLDQYLENSEEKDISAQLSLFSHSEEE